MWCDDAVLLFCLAPLKTPPYRLAYTKCAHTKTRNEKYFTFEHLVFSSIFQCKTVPITDTQSAKRAKKNVPLMQTMFVCEHCTVNELKGIEKWWKKRALHSVIGLAHRIWLKGSNCISVHANRILFVHFALFVYIYSKRFGTPVGQPLLSGSVSLHIVLRIFNANENKTERAKTKRKKNSFNLFEPKAVQIDHAHPATWPMRRAQRINMIIIYLRIEK